MESPSPILLEVRDLKKYFPIQRGFTRRTVGHVRAVDGVSFTLREGETLGLVGESGCGKTTTGRVILRAYEPTAGQVLFRHQGQMVDVAQVEQRRMKDLRREMQIIFQDPFSSLNPRMTVLDIISEPLQIHGQARGADLKAQVADLLRCVGLKPQHMNRYPNAFSGGQRQRIGIARALALRPKLIVCDEPVSALDVSIQAQVVNLLKSLQQEFGLTYLFISHDLSVVEHISDRVAVMYLGHMVELAPAQKLYAMPRHPYTEALLSAVPTINPDRPSKRIILSGDVPNPANPPSGCVFHPRCPYVIERCRSEAPAWRAIGEGHLVACHRADELELVGTA
jgi:peptide/nickel transport system ATP-binding protein